MSRVSTFASLAASMLLPMLLTGCGVETEPPPLVLTAPAPAEETAAIPTGAKTASPAGSDWPRMFGPTGDSRSPETEVDLHWPDAGPPVVWRAEVGAGYSAPVIADGRLVVLHRVDDWEVATCFDATTGAVRWDTAWPTGYRCVYEYSSGPYCTPIIDGGRMYVVGAEARAACLDLDSGARLWERDLRSDLQIPEGAFGFGATPLLLGDRLIFNTGGTQPDTGIVALSAATGETLWGATNDGPAYCTPTSVTAGGRDVVLVLTKEHLVCLDPADGAVFRKTPFGVRNSPERVNAVSPLRVSKDSVLITSGPGPGAQLIRATDDRTAEVVWATRRRGLESQYTNITIHDGLAFGYSPRTACELRCIDLADGSLVWSWDDEHRLRRSMSIAVGKGLIALDSTGKLMSLAPDREGPKVIAATTEPLLAEPCFTQPALSHGRLYLRNEQEVVCLSLRPDATVAATTE